MAATTVDGCPFRHSSRGDMLVTAAVDSSQVRLTTIIYKLITTANYRYIRYPT